MKFFYWLPAVIWAGVIFFLSARSGSELSSMFPILENFNWGHLVAYFVLGICVYYALKNTTAGTKITVLTVLICFLYGVSDEFHQHFVPGRSPEVIDLINDGLGAYIGAYLTGRKMRSR